jgi:transcription elongation factor S-II
MSNYTDAIDYIKNTTIDTFDSTKLYSHKAEMITENSKDIPQEMITHALSKINRAEYFIKLVKLINDTKIAFCIESSIFEFSLIMTSINNMEKNLVTAIYDDRFTDIYMNLDDSSRLHNTTLKKYVIDGVINPKFVAFLSPDQTHPENWAPILNKIKFREKTENNMASTDMYKCYKCGERKCKVSELQLRSADEPISRFVTCLVCYNTFIK